MVPYQCLCFAGGDIKPKSDVIPNARASPFLHEVFLLIGRRVCNSLLSPSNGTSEQRSSIIVDIQTKKWHTFLRLERAFHAFPILSPGAPIFSLSRNTHNSTARATALENAVAMYDLRFTIYDLLIMCALRKFFESSTCADEFASSVTMMTV